MTDTPQSPSDLLARRNLQNIAVKLKAGKTLTTAERKALNEFQSEQSDGWVKDTTTLAKELGLSRGKRSTTRAPGSRTRPRSTRTVGGKISPRGSSSAPRT
jgi:hypothetical protein